MRTKLNRGELQGRRMSGGSVKRVSGPFLSQGKLRPPLQHAGKKAAPSPVPKIGTPSPQGRGLGSDPCGPPLQEGLCAERSRLSAIEQHENRLASQRCFRKRLQENLSKHRWLVLEGGRAYHGLQRTAG